MAVSLSKGGNVSLSKEAPGLRNITVGLGWDQRVTDGSAFDLDASVFVVDGAGRVLDDRHFVFYGNRSTPDGAVAHQGDNLTGQGDGDDEKVKVDLARLAPNAEKLVFAVTIHEADQRRQNFGMVQNAFIRVVNDADNRELARYDLSEDASTETAMIFGEVYRHNGEFKLRAIGQGFAGGLGPLARSFGVNVA
jgi:tellurium resistance protein TerD